MYKIEAGTWQSDCDGLPAELQLAWLSTDKVHATITRLTADMWGFRPVSAQGAWYIVHTDDVMAYLTGLRVPTPYTPPSRHLPPKPPQPPTKGLQIDGN